MSSPAQSPLCFGQVLEIGFPTFTPRITIHSERELTVEVIAGDNAGFADTTARLDARSMRRDARDTGAAVTSKPPMWG
jgi:hypothetical protein